MRVLVTGAAGFIGANLVDALLAQGYRVLGLDCLDGDEPQAVTSTRLQKARDNERFFFGSTDVTDLPAVQQQLGDFRPQVVFHLASRSQLEWSEAHRQECLDLHVNGLLNVLDACVAAGVGQLVSLSAAHVYGASRDFPFKENQACDRPLSILGAALRAAELAARAMAMRHGLPLTMVRRFSVYGPGQYGRRLLPQLAQYAEQGLPMKIYGDGTAARDFIFIDDLVAGLLQLVEQPQPWRIINLASGQTSTVGQLAEMLAWKYDAALQLESQESRPGEMPQSFADIQLARHSIGFTPRVGLEEGVSRFVDWHKSRPTAFRQLAPESGNSHE